MALAGLSSSVTLAVIWALLATAVAFLPMRWQIVPGTILLIAAPAIIIALGLQHGWLPALGGTAACLSMFRKPLAYYWRRLRGVPQ
ncbi:DUF2484 family protein [Parasedimentitalea maritima]|uniref:DUF2484 family protein n=1 Tax=Parasedimentitalea maritima TaxID=2578117 RepID=A0ABY2UYS4_9RHOB|nr:DUF2484 family protein [Zongyanglinia marina]TLP67831.1 DUF2484 family protein [Zongyanglinia marina]